MKIIVLAILATLGASAAAGAQGLIGVSTSDEAAALILSNPDRREELIRSAIGLGVADPVGLTFALLTPDSPVVEAEATARTLTLAAPRLADEVAAATALSTATTEDQARLVGLIGAVMAALADTDLTEADREAEALEVLAALLAVARPDLAAVLADAVAGEAGGGATLLAALGEGPQTAAIPARRSFGAPPISLTLIPNTTAQDAPSAN